MHTESGDRSQFRRSHWQQFPFKHLESWRSPTQTEALKRQNEYLRLIGALLFIGSS